MSGCGRNTQQDIAIANFQIILPFIWEELTSEDKWSIGQAYADEVNKGNNRLAKVLKSLLSKVKGFDYVPENLRSKTFIEAAIELKKAHSSYQNYYLEPGAAKRLNQLGTIPRNALGPCLSAILLCKLGNSFGISFDAQSTLNSMLSKIGPNQWQYYLESVLPTDREILQKIIADKYKNHHPYDRWVSLIEEYNLNCIDINNQKINRFLKACSEQNESKAKKIAKDLLEGNIK